MKNKLAALIITVAGSLSFTASADIISSLNEYKEQGAQYLCRKGDAWDFTYSIRSGTGMACQNKAIAALATYVCLKNNYEDFDKSDCFAKAQEVLGKEVFIKGEDDKIDLDKTVANAKAALIEQAAIIGAKAFALTRAIIGF